jgi:hypothetical protein
MSEQETAFTDSFNRQLLQHGINTNIKILKTTGEWSTASGIDDNSDSERITIRQNFRGACLQISNNGTIHYLTVMRELMFGESQLYFYPNKEGLNGINLFRDVSHHQIESYHKLQAITGDHLGTFGLIVNSLIHV